MKLYLVLLLSLALLNSTIAQNLRGSSILDSIGSSSASRKLAQGSNDSAASILAGLQAAAIPSQSNVNTTDENIPQDQVPNPNSNQTGPSNKEDFTPVDLEQAHNDDVFMSNFEFALNYVLTLGIQSTLLKDVDYNVTQVYDIYQQATDNNGINYKVNFQLQDQGGAVVNITFVTNYQASSFSRQILSFSYEYQYLNSNNILLDVQVAWSNNTDKIDNYVITTTQIANLNDPSSTEDSPSINTYDLSSYLALGGYKEIPVDSVNSNEFLTNMMLFGAQGLVDQGKQNGFLDPNSSYNLVQIYSIHGQQSSDGKTFFFRFEIGMDNGAGSTARANYEMYYDASSDGPSLYSNAFSSIQNV